MVERTNLRIEANVVPPDSTPRPAETSPVLPIISAPPSALSPLAGRRLLLTVPHVTAANGARSLAEDMAFQDRLALAAHLAGLDAEVLLAPVGAPLPDVDRRSAARSPGVAAWDGAPIAPPHTDPGACADDIAAIAGHMQADLVLLHEPALAAARRDARPTVVFCESSPVLEWRARQGDAPAPAALQALADLERLGLHAADRVLTSSRALAAELVALHGLTLPPAVVPPVLRKPEPHEKAGGETGLVLVGGAQADACAFRMLDQAAARLCGQALVFDFGAPEHPSSLSLEHAHQLAAMTAAAAEALLLRAAAFTSLSSGLSFDRLAWRAASAGSALVLPDTRAHREFWEGAAHFVSLRDEAGLACALRRMLEDEDHRRRTAAAALRRARALSNGPAIAALHKTLSAALGATSLTAAL